jgi:hypothetical protein
MLLAEASFTMNLAVPRRIVAKAREWLRDRPYDWANSRPGGRMVWFGIGVPTWVEYAKLDLCNLFVGEVLNEVNADLPIRQSLRGGYPIPANWWFDGTGYNASWGSPINPSLFPARMFHPIPGDVICDEEHVGIVSTSNPDGTGTTISAPTYAPGGQPQGRPSTWQRNALIENDWGFRPGQRGSIRIARHNSVEPMYTARMETGRPQPLQYPRY